MTTVLRDYSWSEITNLLFLSQPVNETIPGTWSIVANDERRLALVSFDSIRLLAQSLTRPGFSYSEEEVGFLDPTYLIVDNTGGADEKEGRWAVIDPTKEDNSRLAAVTAWELLQGFYSGLPQLNSDIKSTDFHLWCVPPTLSPPHTIAHTHKQPGPSPSAATGAPPSSLTSTSKTKSWTKTPPPPAASST